MNFLDSCHLQHRTAKIRIWWINVQYWSMPINVQSNSKHWYQCFSIKIIADHCQSIWINSSQFISMLFNVDIDRHWSAMIVIEKHFRSMPRIWSHIDPYWSALHIDPSCPVISITYSLHNYVGFRCISVVWGFVQKSTLLCSATLNHWNLFLDRNNKQAINTMALHTEVLSELFMHA